MNWFMMKEAFQKKNDCKFWLCDSIDFILGCVRYSPLFFIFRIAVVLMQPV